MLTDAEKNRKAVLDANTNKTPAEVKELAALVKKEAVVLTQDEKNRKAALEAKANKTPAEVKELAALVAK